MRAGLDDELSIVIGRSVSALLHGRGQPMALCRNSMISGVPDLSAS
jgi:hypothetical protein